MTVKATSETKVFRRFDGRGQLFNFSSIEVGDIVAVDGVLDATVGTLTVNASKIQDFSAQARDANYSGTIKNGSINVTAKTFTLDIPANDTDLIVVASTTTKIKKFLAKTKGTEETERVEKDVEEITFGDLRDGDVVKSAIGVANTATMKLLAREIVVTERDVSQKKIENVFATVVSVDQGNSMVVKTTAGVTYTVSFRSPSTSYKSWTVSKRYSGKKNGTDGVSAPSTLSGLKITDEDKVWIDGMADTRTNQVIPTVIWKEFYR